MSRPWVDLDDESGQIFVNRPRWVARRLYRWARKAQLGRYDAETARLRALGLPQSPYDRGPGWCRPPKETK